MLTLTKNRIRPARAYSSPVMPTNDASSASSSSKVSHSSNETSWPQILQDILSFWERSLRLRLVDGFYFRSRWKRILGEFFSTQHSIDNYYSSFDFIRVVIAELYPSMSLMPESDSNDLCRVFEAKWMKSRVDSLLVLEHGIDVLLQLHNLEDGLTTAAEEELLAQWWIDDHELDVQLQNLAPGMSCSNRLPMVNAKRSLRKCLQGMRSLVSSDPHAIGGTTASSASSSSTAISPFLRLGVQDDILYLVSGMIRRGTSDDVLRGRWEACFEAFVPTSLSILDYDHAVDFLRAVIGQLCPALLKASVAGPSGQPEADANDEEWLMDVAFLELLSVHDIMREYLQNPQLLLPGRPARDLYQSAQLLEPASIKLPAGPVASALLHSRGEFWLKDREQGKAEQYVRSMSLRLHMVLPKVEEAEAQLKKFGERVKDLRRLQETSPSLHDVATEAHAVLPVMAQDASTMSNTIDHVEIRSSSSSSSLSSSGGFSASISSPASPDVVIETAQAPTEKRGGSKRYREAEVETMLLISDQRTESQTAAAGTSIAVPENDGQAQPTKRRKVTQDAKGEIPHGSLEGRPRRSVLGCTENVGLQEPNTVSDKQESTAPAAEDDVDMLAGGPVDSVRTRQLRSTYSRTTSKGRGKSKDKSKAKIKSAVATTAAAAAATEEKHKNNSLDEDVEMEDSSSIPIPFAASSLTKGDYVLCKTRTPVWVGKKAYVERLVSTLARVEGLDHEKREARVWWIYSRENLLLERPLGIGEKTKQKLEQLSFGANDLAECNFLDDITFDAVVAKLDGSQVHTNFILSHDVCSDTFRLAQREE